MTTATTSERTQLSSKNDRLKGSATIYREADGSYTVSRETHDGPYDVMTGFKTYKAAKAEQACYV